MSSQGVAFFDLDNTIIRGGSLFHLARGLQRRRFFSKGEIANFFWKHLKFVVIGRESLADMDSIRAMALNFIAGHEVSELMALSEEIVDSNILPKVYEGSRALAEGHLNRGEEVWIVTASPQQVANLLAERLGFTGALGTLAEVVDGRYTGKLNGPVLHGSHKPVAVREFAAQRGIDLAACTAYSDSFNDLPLLEAVGHPVVVNADYRLRAWARRRGWPSYDFRKMRYARKYSLPALLAALATLLLRTLRRPRG